MKCGRKSMQGMGTQSVLCFLRISKNAFLYKTLISFNLPHKETTPQKALFRPPNFHNFNSSFNKKTGKLPVFVISLRIVVLFLLF